MCASTLYWVIFPASKALTSRGHNIQRFAESYGLIPGQRWYTEFVSGRSVAGRKEFRQFIEDARLDLFDVLLVDHTSRFGRNQADCIRYKEEMQGLGKVVVFVSQGIISGSDRNFLNETLDEQVQPQPLPLRQGWKGGEGGQRARPGPCAPGIQNGEGSQWQRSLHGAR